MKLKIISWNIWVKGNFDLISSFLKESSADIICLQEVQADDPNMDVIKFLSGFGYHNVFAPVQRTHSGKTWNDGPAIFSRYPIVKKATYILSRVNGRAAVFTDIKIDDIVFHVFNTHLMHTHQKYSEIQDEQVTNLLDRLPRDRTILVGDFNSTPDSATIKKARSVLVDSDPSSKPTWSQYVEGCDKCKLGDISIRLDYIFTTKDFKTSVFKVESSKASDHLPISVTVEI